jgi:uncharacterized protein (TIGR03086 family)
MDNVGLLRKVVAETSRVVANTSSAELDNPSPCEAWTVRDVLNHITGGATMFAMSAESGSVPDEVVGQLMGGDNLGDDPQSAWRTASTRALAAFEQPGVLDKVVKLPFGEMPAGVALNIAVFDVATHACDIAYGTGQDIEDDATFEQALEMGKQVVGPDFRIPGVFDAEQACAAGSPVRERLLAFGGRKL